MVQRTYLPAVLIAFFFLGCGGRTLPAPADPDAAVEALRSVLDHWAAGASPQTLRESEPAIHVADEDWLAGYELREYQIGNARPHGIALAISARLSLRNPQGRAVQKPVIYVVGMDPRISVVRQD